MSRAYALMVVFVVCAEIHAQSSYAEEAIATIANTKTTIPDGSTLINFGSPAADNENVIFLGVNDGPTQRGIYSATTTGIAVIADQSQTIPGQAGLFVGFGTQPSIDAGLIAFQGRGASGFEGIYVGDGLGIGIVADTQTLAPGSADFFTSFSIRPATSGENVAFAASAGATNGVYALIDGVLITIAVGIPSSTVDILDDTVLFTTGIPGARGISIYEGGSISNLIGPGDTLGGKTLRSAAFEGRALETDSVAFKVIFTDDTQSIVWAQSVPIIFEIIASTGDPIPDSSSNFLNFNSPAIDGNTLAFIGGDGVDIGLYRFTDSTSITTIADKNTQFPAGETFGTFGSNYAVDNGDVIFSNGQSIYRSRISEPSSFILKVLPAILHQSRKKD